MANKHSTIFKQETVASWFSGTSPSANSEPFRDAEQVILKYNQAIQNNSLTQEGWERLMAQSDKTLAAYLTSIRGSAASMAGYTVSLQGGVGGFKKISSAIAQYNALSGSSEEDQKAFTSAVSASNKSLGGYLSGLKGSNASLGGYCVSLAGAAVKTIGLQIATTALNSAISMGASLLISGAVSAISAWINREEIMAQKADEARSNIESLNKDLKDHQDFVSDSGKRFAELSQGVDQLTGKNISLDSDDYKEFLDLSNQLAETFPSLSRIYDDNGNSIVQLSGDVDTIVGSLQNMIEAEKHLANQKILENTPDVFKDVKSKSNDYALEMDNLKSKRDSLEKSRDILQGNGTDNDIFSQMDKRQIKVEDIENDSVIDQYNSYLSILENAGLIVDNNFNALTTHQDGMVLQTGFTIDILSSDEEIEAAKSKIASQAEALAEEYSAEIEKLDEKIAATEEKNKGNWSSMGSSIFAWMSDDDTFKVMDDSSKALMQRMADSLDWSELNFGSWDEATEYIKENILSLYDTEDGRAALAQAQEALNAQAQFNSGELTAGEYQARMQGFISSTDALPEDTRNAIRQVAGIQTDKNGGATFGEESLVQDVQGMLRPEDAGKASSLTLPQLQAAAEQVEIPEGQLLSWDELSAKIDEIQSKAVPFQEAWAALDTTDDSSMAGLKEELLSLAEAGQLTAESFQKTGGSESFLKTLGIRPDDTEKIEELVDRINKLKSSEEQLSSMGRGISSLSSNLAQRQSAPGTAISADTFAGMDESLKSQGAEWERYVSVLGNASSSMEEVQEATNSLATAYVNSGSFLSNLTEQNKDYYISQLSAMGVDNAAEVVQQSLAEKYQVNDLQLRALEITKSGINDQTLASLDNLFNEAGAYDNVRFAIANYIAEEQIFGNSNLSTDEKIAALDALAQKYYDVGEAAYFSKMIEAANKNAGNPHEELTPEGARNQFLKEMGYKPGITVDIGRKKSTQTGTGAGGGGGSKGSQASQQPQEREKTPLERFREWFSALFDWIELRLERQADLISRYTKRAEAAADSGRYGTAAGNYQSAIRAASVQSGYQKDAAAAYEGHAGNVLARAVSMGVVTQGQADDIRAKVESGSLEISEYSDEVREIIKDYQAWHDKATKARDAIDELHESIRGYVKDLKDMRETQRDARAKTLDTYTGIGTGGQRNTLRMEGAALKYEFGQMERQKKAYRDSTKYTGRDMYALRRDAGKAAGNALKSAGDQKYAAALKSAQRAVQAKKPVSSRDMKAILAHSPSVYGQLYAYNLSLENLEAAKLAEAANYAEASQKGYQNRADRYKAKNDAKNDAISLLRQKSSNADTLKYKNKSLNKAAGKYRSILKTDKDAVASFDKSVRKNTKTIRKTAKDKGYGNAGKKDKKAVDAAIKAARAAAKSGKPISPGTIAALARYRTKGYISRQFYQACIAYNNALDSKGQAEAQLEADKEMAKAERAAIGTEKFQNIEQKYANKVNEVQSQMDAALTKNDLKTTRGESLTEGDYQQLISHNKTIKGHYQNEIAELERMIASNTSGKNPLWSKSSQKYKDAMQMLEEYRQKAAECDIQQEEWNNAIANLPFQAIEKALEALDATSEMYKSETELKTARGEDLTEKDYTQQIDLNNEKIKQHEAQKKAAEEAKEKALKDPKGVYGGKTAAEWNAIAEAATTGINNLKTSNEDLKDSLRDDVYWRSFNKAQEEAQRLLSVINGIVSLISEEMMFGEDGELTDYGMLGLSKMLEQRQTTSGNVIQLNDQIKELDSMYQQNLYNMKEYKQARSDLINQMLEEMASLRSADRQVADILKNTAQSELDSLFQLIDARKEALAAKKAYYDYDKTLRGKTKDIQSLQAQIAALEGIETAEAKAKRAMLNAQLTEAREDLNDTIQEHSLEISQQSLDDLKETLQESFEETWSKILRDPEALKNLLEEAKDLIKANMDTIDETYEKLLYYFGVDSENLNLDHTPPEPQQPEETPEKTPESESKPTPPEKTPESKSKPTSPEKTPESKSKPTPPEKTPKTPTKTEVPTKEKDKKKNTTKKTNKKEKSKKKKETKKKETVKKKVELVSNRDGLVPIVRNDELIQAEPSRFTTESSVLALKASASPRSIPTAEPPKQAAPILQFTQNNDCLLRVDGNVDRDALPGLQELLQMSCNYTVGEIVKDARKKGVKI